MVALLALLGCFVASYLALYKLGYIGQLSCAVGSCERVNTSRWAVFLGAPVALWGVAFYLVVFAVAVIGSLPRYGDERGVSVLLGVIVARRSAVHGVPHITRVLRHSRHVHLVCRLGVHRNDNFRGQRT